MYGEDVLGYGQMNQPKYLGRTLGILQVNTFLQGNQNPSCPLCDFMGNTKRLKQEFLSVHVLSCSLESLFLSRSCFIRWIFVLPF